MEQNRASNQAKENTANVLESARNSDLMLRPRPLQILEVIWEDDSEEEQSMHEVNSSNESVGETVKQENSAAVQTKYKDILVSYLDAIDLQTQVLDPLFGTAANQPVDAEVDRRDNPFVGQRWPSNQQSSTHMHQLPRISATEMEHIKEVLRDIISDTTEEEDQANYSNQLSEIFTKYNIPTDKYTDTDMVFVGQKLHEYTQQNLIILLQSFALLYLRTQYISEIEGSTKQQSEHELIRILNTTARKKYTSARIHYANQKLVYHNLYQYIIEATEYLLDHLENLVSDKRAQMSQNVANVELVQKNLPKIIQYPQYFKATKSSAKRVQLLIDEVDIKAAIVEIDDRLVQLHEQCMEELYKVNTQAIDYKNLLSASPTLNDFIKHQPPPIPLNIQLRQMLMLEEKMEEAISRITTEFNSSQYSYIGVPHFAKFAATIRANGDAINRMIKDHSPIEELLSDVLQIQELTTQAINLLKHAVPYYLPKTDAILEYLLYAKPTKEQADYLELLIDIKHILKGSLSKLDMPKIMNYLTTITKKADNIVDIINTSDYKSMDELQRSSLKTRLDLQYLIMFNKYIVWDEFIDKTIKLLEPCKDKNYSNLFTKKDMYKIELLISQSSRARKLSIIEEDSANEQCDELDDVGKVDIMAEKGASEDEDIEEDESDTRGDERVAVEMLKDETAEDMAKRVPQAIPRDIPLYSTKDTLSTVGMSRIVDMERTIDSGIDMNSTLGTTGYMNGTIDPAMDQVTDEDNDETEESEGAEYAKLPEYPHVDLVGHYSTAHINKHPEPVTLLATAPVHGNVDQSNEQLVLHVPPLPSQQHDTSIFPTPLPSSTVYNPEHTLTTRIPQTPYPSPEVSPQPSQPSPQSLQEPHPQSPSQLSSPLSLSRSHQPLPYPPLPSVSQLIRRPTQTQDVSRSAQHSSKHSRSPFKRIFLVSTGIILIAAAAVLFAFSIYMGINSINNPITI